MEKYELTLNQEKEIKEIYYRIGEKLGVGEFLIKDKNLKIRIAKFILELIDQTVLELEDIEEVSYNIFGWFGKFNYNDELDEVLDIAGDLEGVSHVIGEPKEIFRRMRRIVEKYIDNKI